MTLTMTQRRALAQILSAVEDGAENAAEILRQAYSATGQANIVGVTGPPGAGKSTLINQLAMHWSDRNRSVAILACDPSSPFSRGALLGDRVRMDGLSARTDIFMRSLSLRGAHGGIASVTADCCAVLRAHGFDMILLETVGAGQSDIAVSTVADCVLAVSVPGLGDGLQAEKAGLLELADIHALNKCDLTGAGAHAIQISAILDIVYSGPEGVSDSPSGPAGPAATGGHRLAGVAALRKRHGDPEREALTWRPPVLQVSATTGRGLDALAGAVEAFLHWQSASGRLDARRTGQMAELLLERLSSEIVARLARNCGADIADLAHRAALDIAAGASTPHDAMDSMCAALLAADRQRSPSGAANERGQS